MANEKAQSMGQASGGVLKPAANPQSDFFEVELVHPLENCSKRERKAQRVNQIRIDQDVWFKEHPAGVEVCGAGAWQGVVPWSNIKMARRNARGK